MTAIKTELDFSYQPIDFFEEPLTLPMQQGTLKINNGNALYTLATPVDEVSETLRLDVAQETTQVFRLRQMLTNRPHQLSGPNVRSYYANGGTGITIHAALESNISFTGTIET